MQQQNSTSNPIQYNKENINELSEKIVNEPYQAKLDKLDLSSAIINKPAEKVKTSFSAKLSEKSQDFLDNEPRRIAKLDEPGKKILTFSPVRSSKKCKDFSDNKQRKPYIITKKIVYESCAIGCKWNMIYK